MDFHADPSQDPHGWHADDWVDPLEERERFRLRLLRFRLGFSLLGLALVVASLSEVGFLFMIFAQFRQPIGVILGIPHFELIEGAIITWGSLLGVCLLWGTWPDVHWQRRSGILLLMCLVDASLWTIRHAGELGLYDGSIGHEWLRDAIGSAMAWSEFALIASLTADAAGHLGEPRALDLARSIRSLATTGAMVWFLYFAMRTDWSTTVWPLRARMFNPATFMLLMSWIVLSALCFVQTAGLCLVAGRCCARTLVEMAKADRASDPILTRTDEPIRSRSEDGWEEMIRKYSGPKNGA